jgi:lantibiotic leader peptide-processing serine protease
MQKHRVRRALLLLTGVVLTLAFAGAASAGRYIVLYKGSSVPADGGAKVRAAGGTVIASYSQIGVIVAESSRSTFRDAILKDTRVENASATTNLGIHVDTVEAATGESSGDLPNVPATDAAEPLFGLQWDMRQIHTPEAHAITGGSPAVVVADLDTGLDFTHPDIAPNYDPTHSTNCETGAPTPLVAGNDQNGHGTHTAGTIAAAANGIGIVGVAPNVKIAGIKTANDDGFFFPEMVVCAFMFAGNTQVDVTNNSYFADPYLFNCHNDKTQQAIWKAESRAIKYAQSRGVTVVAAAGNFSDDLAHPTQDILSPDTGPGETRAIRNNCVVIPVEVSGVIGVSATGVERRKAYYSNYGTGVIDVAAPGGDRFQIDAAQGAVNGRVLSTWPAYLPCARQENDPAEPTAVYCYLQGTSMASPHVAGLAALVISRYGDSSNPQNGHMRPGAVEALIQQTADPTACPDDMTPYEPFPSFSNNAPQECTGGTGHNSWYGNGIVNAYRAVTH